MKDCTHPLCHEGCMFPQACPEREARPLPPVPCSAPYRSEIDGNMSIRSDAKGRFFVLMEDGGWQPIEKVQEPSDPVYGIMDPDYARFLSMARCIAKAEGYALAVHGSFSRDLDVIAIPWVAEPNSTPSQLAHQIAGRTGLTLHPVMQLREHGRMTWTMHFKEFGDPRYIDFSATPLLPQNRELSQPGSVDNTQ